MAHLLGVDERTVRRWAKPNEKELQKSKGIPFAAWKLFLLETKRIKLE